MSQGWSTTPLDVETRRYWSLGAWGGVGVGVGVGLGVGVGYGYGYGYGYG